MAMGVDEGKSVMPRSVTVFVIVVVFWTGFVYSQVLENREKINENNEKATEVAEIAGEVIELKAGQRHMRNDVNEIKGMLREILREGRAARARDRS